MPYTQTTFPLSISLLLSLCLSLGLLLCSFASEAKTIGVDYHVSFVPERKIAEVSIEIDDVSEINAINFNIEKSLCYDFTGTDEVTSENGRLIWAPKSHPAKLSYQCAINNERGSKNDAVAYDAFITRDWTIFRGDDIVPPAVVRFKKGASTEARLWFELPSGWNGVNTGWPPVSDERKINGLTGFDIDNPERIFDRPTGWIIAGKLGTRRVKIDSPNVTRIAVSAPVGSRFKQMDVLTFLQFVWPEFTEVCGKSPEKLLVVGGDSPMWRGGLSAGNSFYVHADRPLVSENGTSTFLHELFHMCSRIRGKTNSDWIAEGLAEYYSVKILHKAGGSFQQRYERTLNGLEEWGSSAKSLNVERSAGAITAKAAMYFATLDEQIQTATKGKHSLDDVVHKLMKIIEVDGDDLKQATKEVAGFNIEFPD
ncbi:MAG: hypothetical protein AAGJ37_00210 [Pseudomonadota bacterium]